MLAEVNEQPTDALKALVHCDEGLLPNLEILLRILSTIPITTSTPERTFSALQGLKTYLSSTMNQDRSTGLAHLYINTGFNLTPDEVIDQFATNNCRLVL